LQIYKTKALIIGTISYLFSQNKLHSNQVLAPCCLSIKSKVLLHYFGQQENDGHNLILISKIVCGSLWLV